jgi:hypothetical protein
MNTRHEIQSQIEKTLASMGAEVEITIGSSIARGDFVSVFGMPRDCDIARGVMSMVGNATFTDRDIDDEDPEVVDFYAI